MKNKITLNKRNECIEFTYSFNKHSPNLIVCFSIGVIKHHFQEHLGEERVYLAYKLQSVIQKSYGVSSRRKLKAGHKAEPTVLTGLVPLPVRISQTACVGVCHPQWSECPHTNQQLRKCPTDGSTGQSNRKSPSVEVPFPP